MRVEERLIARPLNLKRLCDIISLNVPFLSLSLQTFPGLMPYKRPAPDNKGYPLYQPSAAAYQQLMQLQSQQPYVPVSCEYSSSQPQALADTLYPNTSTATLNANNLHHHLNLYSQTSLNACNSSNNNNNDNLNINNNNDYNNFHTSTVFADADAQINQTSTAQQNSISQSSPSKAVTPSNILIEHNALSKNAVATNAVAAATSPDDGDSENALIVQAAKLIGASGTDDTVLVLSSGFDNNNSDESNKVGDEDDLPSLQNNHVATDDTTQPSILSATDENNLNANSFNSATSSSPAASLSAIYTTSSITNNNNSILSRKNSLTTPNQHLINSSKAPTSYTNTPSAKVDTVPDYLSASSLNNHPQAALLSAMLYNQPYQQLALTQNLYSDPAQMAKEMAQKNYANALKYAVSQQQQQNSSAQAKSQMTAMPYSGMTLSANGAAMYAQQPGTSAARLPSPMTQAVRSPYMQTLTRPLQNHFQQFMRPQMPVGLSAATNPYYAAAAAHQQFLSQQSMMYSGMASQMTSQSLTATSGASTTPSPYGTSSYPFAYSQAQAMSAQGLPASMMQVPQMTSQPSQTGASSAVVLNPYKKMKTS